MASQQYSVRDMLPIRGDGVARPGAPEPKPIPAAVAKIKPKPAAKPVPHAELLRKVHAIAEHWAKQPYVPENFHKALEEVLGVMGGKDGIPELSGLRRSYRTVRDEAANQQVKEDD